MSRDLVTEIRPLINEYAAAFVAGDMSRVKALWDPAAEDRTYVGAELDAPIFGTAALEAYYDALAGAFVVTKGEVGDIAVREIDGLAYVVTHIDWTFSMGEQQFVQRIRATVLLRQRADRWRFIQMHESIQWKLPG